MPPNGLPRPRLTASRPKVWYRRGWVLFRQIAVLLLVVDLIIFYIRIGQENSPRMIRCIFPFFFISRRRNLRLMVQVGAPPHT